MIETTITLCILGIAEVACIIGLIIIHFQEKKMKKTNALQRCRQLAMRKKAVAEMIDKEKVIKGLETCIDRDPGTYICNECPYEIDGNFCEINLAKDAIALLKEQRYEYENGFNDAMLGKQELMYEGTDGKWHKKDW